ncbi:hypothetical protein BGX30_011197 [Mortierella sp. GBA39]|nr:hypothetical protein BGX30_011197 [Mortierella sp. GBA39]
MRCIKLPIRLVLLVALTAQLIHGLVLDSSPPHTDENSQLQQQLHEPHDQQQTSLSNPPSSSSRKDVVLAAATVEDEAPMSVTSEAEMMHLDVPPLPGRIQDIVSLRDGELQQQQTPQVQQGQEQLARTMEEEEEEEEDNDEGYFCGTQTWDEQEQERRRERGLPDLNDEVEDYGDEDGWFPMIDSQDLDDDNEDADAMTATRGSPDYFYHYVNDNYPGLKPPPPKDGRTAATTGPVQDQESIYNKGQQHQGQPSNGDSQKELDQIHFSTRIHGQGRQVNIEDKTLVRFQILDHRLVLPEDSRSRDFYKTLFQGFEDEDGYQKDHREAEQSVGTKSFKPQLRPQPMKVSSWYPASRTVKHKLWPSMDYLKEGGENPEVLSTVWKRLRWSRRLNRLEVLIEDDGSSGTVVYIKPKDGTRARLENIKTGPPAPVPELWQKVIRDTVRSSCNASKADNWERRTYSALYDDWWDPQEYEHERLSLFPRAGGDPSNDADGSFKEFSSPRCPMILSHYRFQDYAFVKDEFWMSSEDREAEPWKLELNETASVHPTVSEMSRKGTKKDPQVKRCKFWPDDFPYAHVCENFKMDLWRARCKGQKPSGGYLSLLPEWRVVTGWIVITDLETNELKEQHLVQVEVPEIQNDGSLLGETVCHLTW